MLEPLPSIVSASVTSRSPLPGTIAPEGSAGPSVNVYVRPLPRMMRSAPGLALAAMIASRSEQSALQLPSALSVVLVTTKSVANAGVPKSASRHTAKSAFRDLRCGSTWLQFRLGKMPWSAMQ